jgi:hypothetical protein
MWSDNETPDDLVGFKVHADLIREMIMDPSVLPVTIGVFGDWGGGKSSIMQMLKNDFETRAMAGGIDDRPYVGVAVLYFNGWLFEGYDDAKSAILTSVLTSLRDHQRFGPKIKDHASRLLRQVDLMRGARIFFSGIARAGVIAGATGGLAAPLAAAEMARAGGEALNAALPTEPKADEIVPDVRGFREGFAQMLKDSDIKTLVVLVDDLDRCSPERIIENLEAIKLFLNVPSTAFVIGADPRIVRHAVAYRYRDAFTPRAGEGESLGADADRLVTDYLEKLLQITYRLPRLSPSEIETYLVLLFCRRELIDDQFQLCASRARSLRDTDRYRTFGYRDVEEALKPVPVHDRLKEALRLCSAIAGHITDVLQGNPRQVKRFLNTFFLRRRLADVAKLKGVRDEILVKLMLLEYKSGQTFSSVLGSINPETGLSELLKRAEAGQLEEKDGKAWSGDLLAKWLKLEPLLAEIDLRDYLWVTRDRLASTLSGITMVAPRVRQVIAFATGDHFKQKAVPDLLKELTADEHLQLWQQVLLLISRTPTEFAGYKLMCDLLESGHGMPGEADEAIVRINGKDLPPALGVRLRQMVKKQPSWSQSLPKCVAYLTADSGKAGKAFRQP